MKAILYALLACFLVLGCKTKKSSLQENYSNEVTEISKSLDSITEVATSLIKEIQEKTNKQSSRLILRPVMDSNGIAMPISFTERINGHTVREINLSGGVLEETNEVEETKINSLKSKDSLSSSSTSKSDFALTDTTDYNLDQKEESEPATGGFWSRFKLWIIIVLLIALLFLSWRLKLF